MRLSFYVSTLMLATASILGVAGGVQASPITIDLTRDVESLLPDGPSVLVEDFAVTPGSSLTIDVAGSTSADGTGALNTNGSVVGVITNGTNASDTLVGASDSITVTFNFDGELVSFETANIGPVTLTGPSGAISFNSEADGLTGTPAISPFSFVTGDQITFGVSSSISGLVSLTVIPTPATASLLVLASLATLRRQHRRA